MKSKKKSAPSREQRRMRAQQIVFSVIAVLVIITWVIGLITRVVRSGLAVRGFESPGFRRDSL